MRSLFIFGTLIFLFNCKTQQVPITAIEWKLTKMSTTNLTLLNKPITITMDEATNKISGYGGCNRYFGEYETNGSISFSRLGATKMYCENTNQIESAYFKALESVMLYKTEGNKLYFFVDGKVALEFSK